MKKTRTTDTQRETLNNLRARLGELGYFICVVASRHRRSKYDFVAAPKSEFYRKNILLVRPDNRNRIIVRPYQRTGDYYHIRLRFEDLRRKKGFHGLRWVDKQVGQGVLQPQLWESYISPHSMDEMKKLQIPLDR